jgi:hypothetical protein
MIAIVVEGVLFVALIATVAALFYLVLMQFTPLGVRVRQIRNRRRIERAAARVCSIHGPHADSEMVLLPDGDRVCPECYTEIIHE